MSDEAVKSLIVKAEKAKSADEALKFSQAGLQLGQCYVRVGEFKDD